MATGFKVCAQELGRKFVTKMENPCRYRSLNWEGGHSRVEMVYKNDVLVANVTQNSDQDDPGTGSLETISYHHQICSVVGTHQRVPEVYRRGIVP